MAVELVVQAAPLPYRTSPFPRRVCVVSNYALARPWFTFFMCPIELDPVQLVMAVYPLGRPPTQMSERGPSDASVAAAAARTTVVCIWGHFASKTLPFFIAVASDGRARAFTDSPSTP